VSLIWACVQCVCLFGPVWTPLGYEVELTVPLAPASVVPRKLPAPGVAEAAARPSLCPPRPRQRDWVFIHWIRCKGVCGLVTEWFVRGTRQSLTPPHTPLRGVRDFWIFGPFDYLLTPAREVVPPGKLSGVGVVSDRSCQGVLSDRSCSLLSPGNAPSGSCQGGGSYPARPKLSPSKSSGVRVRPMMSDDNYPGGVSIPPKANETRPPN